VFDVSQTDGEPLPSVDVPTVEAVADDREPTPARPHIGGERQAAHLVVAELVLDTIGVGGGARTTGQVPRVIQHLVLARRRVGRVGRGDGSAIVYPYYRSCL